MGAHDQAHAGAQAGPFQEALHHLNPRASFGVREQQLELVIGVGCDQVARAHRREGCVSEGTTFARFGSQHREAGIPLGASRASEFFPDPMPKLTMGERSTMVSRSDVA